MSTPLKDHLRFHRPHDHLNTTFGNDTFALKAEAFARFFGTPTFLGAQTLVVVLWVAANMTGLVAFDVYPFILLNLAFSLQSAYAAPLILLAQTRQAARDKAQSDADALHREDLAKANMERQERAEQNTALLLQLMEQNTELTETTRQLTERVEALTRQIHQKLV
ncbi:DUF1003 domain-containing protein [Pseudomonas eucalypticola]|uniref:DUF1003 domain-containing protein n=1 Tax=Pseudomonas eucalypticola TaxID=2599595 RepID=A0A7D5D7J1_9PSED|nr:DUF1003 domain-containing protein [Pseudomonas eucalypticola]QKZ05319.1 DUF1003 domain-containing protein [Pseudomonas eucalypticola]